MGVVNHHQRSHRTAYDRYPRVFEAAASGVATSNAPEAQRVLSYGCSTGEEAIGLATLYFPKSRIIGFDIAETVLSEARSRNANDRITYDISSAENLRSYGPFDCIVAMSVLCRWPDTEGLEEIGSIYSFPMFQDAIVELDRHLLVGGVFVVFNSNFNFLDTETSKRYRILPVPRIPHNGFVHRFDKNNRRIKDYALTDCVYRKVG